MYHVCNITGQENFNEMPLHICSGLCMSSQTLTDHQGTLYDTQEF